MVHSSRGTLKPALKRGDADNRGGSPAKAIFRHHRPQRKRVVLVTEPVAVAQLSPPRDRNLWYNEMDFARFEAEADAAPAHIIRGVEFSGMLTNLPRRTDFNWQGSVHTTAPVDLGNVAASSTAAHRPEASTAMVMEVPRPQVSGSSIVNASLPLAPVKASNLNLVTRDGSKIVASPSPDYENLTPCLTLLPLFAYGITTCTDMISDVASA
mmetsp:Transcript_19761/g.59958  ORF Transcript_19761/g.59958 Transcript_19761/m.59958 type:complete len:211 (+) Transcript_19761:51-683(+)